MYQGLNMKTKLATLVAFLTAVIASNAGIYNNGANIVVTTGASVVVQGDIRNEDALSAGAIINDGSIYVSGNVSNNSTGFMFTIDGTAGTLFFNGTGNQLVNGSGTYSFENVSVAASSVPVVSRNSLAQNVALNGTGTNLSITSDFRISGSLSGTGLVQATGNGYLSMKPTNNVALKYPLTDGTHDLSFSITTTSQLNNNLKVRLNNHSGESNTSIVNFWDIACFEEFSNAAISMNIPKSAFKSGSWANTNQFRYFDPLENRYKIIPQSRITIENNANTVNVTISGVGSEIATTID